ncbi:MAG: gamma-glutamyl kinase [Thaumarchaeota archaeon]|nr:gamma-glutamyl kinase [Nitrososphaerota archaeon]
MILIKLGGSIITNKEKPHSARKSTIDKIAKILRKINEPFVVVHGGGSFGHYWSVKYNMHTRPAMYNQHGVAVVKNSMVSLNKIILDSFLKNSLNPYCLPAADFMSGNMPIIKKVKEIENIAKSNLVPVTFGDAMWYGKKKSYILSGDKIMTILAKTLRPRLSIFVLNVDGVFSDLKTRNLIYDMKNQKPQVSKIAMDVTGGMKRKIEEAIRISRLGLDVFFVNGNKPQRIVDAIKRKKFEGTLFRGI